MQQPGATGQVGTVSTVTTSTALTCRNCRAIGTYAEVEADEVTVDGAPLKSVPLLPRCACYVRLHRGKLPASVANILADLPDVPVLAALGARRAAAPPPAVTTEPAASESATKPEAKRMRLVYSLDELPPSKAVRVYRGARDDGALLGTVMVTSEHKLVDVAQLLKDELKVPLTTTLYRGLLGQELRIPLPRTQGQRLALPFFPTEDHYLLI